MIKIILTLLILILSQNIPANDFRLQFQNGQKAFSEKNYEKAHTIWLELAEKGYPQAQSTLAYLYASGTGVDKNFEISAKWMTKAANQGELQSMYNLAGMYFEGKGVDIDYKKSEELYRDSLQKGFKVSVSGLIQLYRNNIIKPKDAKEKEYWEREEKLLLDSNYVQKLYSESRNASMP